MFHMLQCHPSSHSPRLLRACDVLFGAAQHYIEFITLALLFSWLHLYVYLHHTRQIWRPWLITSCNLRHPTWRELWIELAGTKTFWQRLAETLPSCLLSWRPSEGPHSCLCPELPLPIPSFPSYPLQFFYSDFDFGRQQRSKRYKHMYIT